MHLLLSLVLMQDPSASRFDVSGGATAQIQAGRAPPNPGLDPTGAVLLVVAPVARLHWAARARNQTAVLSYSPRLLYRWPNILRLNRPLLLHQVGLQYGRGLTPTWSMFTGLAANIGELDYTTAQQVFGDQQGNLPDASVTSYASIGGTIGFTGLLTPIHRLGFSAGADFRTPYGASTQTDDPDNQALLPQQVSGSGSVTHGYLVRSTDTLTTTLTGQYVDFDNRGASYIVSGTYGWAHQIDSRLTSNVEAGLFLSQQTREPEGFEGRVVGGTPIRPVFAAGLQGRLYNPGAASDHRQLRGQQLGVPRLGGRRGRASRWRIGRRHVLRAPAVDRRRPGQLLPPSRLSSPATSEKTPMRRSSRKRYCRSGRRSRTSSETTATPSSSARSSRPARPTCAPGDFQFPPARGLGLRRRILRVRHRPPPRPQLRRRRLDRLRRLRELSSGGGEPGGDEAPEVADDAEADAEEEAGEDADAGAEQDREDLGDRLDVRRGDHVEARRRLGPLELEPHLDRLELGEQLGMRLLGGLVGARQLGVLGLQSRELLGRSPRSCPGP